jgi:hypothetical protein
MISLHRALETIPDRRPSSIVFSLPLTALFIRAPSTLLIPLSPSSLLSLFEEVIPMGVFEAVSKPARPHKILWRRSV